LAGAAKTHSEPHPAVPIAQGLAEERKGLRLAPQPLFVFRDRNGSILRQRAFQPPVFLVINLPSQVGGVCSILDNMVPKIGILVLPVFSKPSVAEPA
jgi:hypothetical protein